jgi:hypothetical protein
MCHFYLNAFFGSGFAGLGVEEELWVPLPI